jgi:hypothetical protein
VREAQRLRIARVTFPQRLLNGKKLPRLRYFAMQIGIEIEHGILFVGGPWSGGTALWRTIPVAPNAKTKLQAQRQRISGSLQVPLHVN